MRSFSLDQFWYRTLRRPYRLAKPLDSGRGTPVVLLHGIGRTGNTWQHLIELLNQHAVRAVAFDLLGFGASPKPVWPKYDIDDHARAVIASLRRLGAREPIVLVGHSMGCLVAVRVARLRPDLVRHLVLYEMPLYEGLPQKRSYRLRLDLYRRFYQRVISYAPTFNPETAKLVERLARRIIGFEVTAATWLPFVRSLEHTIMKQTTAEDIKRISIPMDVIYGSLDMLVIRGKPRHIFGHDSTHISAHTIRARHIITTKASRFLLERIAVALETPPGEVPPITPKLKTRKKYGLKQSLRRSRSAG